MKNKLSSLILSADSEPSASLNLTFISLSPALAFGSDQDYQIDIINELDLANATYGITQVAGLHNTSKAFLFRGKAHTHYSHISLAAQVHTRLCPPCRGCSAHTRTLFVSLVSVRGPRSATPLGVTVLTGMLRQNTPGSLLS